jgi:hypothetical protein
MPNGNPGCADHLAEVCVMADMQLGNAGGPLALQAATPVGGFALQNGTPTILSWTAPNDGLLHRILVISNLHVTSGETGGAVSCAYSYPDGFGGLSSITPGTTGAGSVPGTFLARNIQAGSMVTIEQVSALTAGAATLWAEIWGS